MIHTIARYFSTTERMTLLLSKISNQLIRNCKLNICQRKTDADLWSMKSETLNATMEDCLRLNEVTARHTGLTCIHECAHMLPRK